MYIKYIISSLILLLTLAGCDIIVDVPRPTKPVIVVEHNYPILHDANALCRWDNFYYDYVWGPPRGHV